MLKMKTSLLLLITHWSVGQNYLSCDIFGGAADEYCRPLSQCAPTYSPASESCVLGDNIPGVCCPDVTSPVSTVSTTIDTRTDEVPKRREPSTVDDSLIETRLADIESEEKSRPVSVVKPASHRLFNKLRREDEEYVELALRLFRLGTDDDDGVGTRSSAGFVGVDSINSNVIADQCPYTNERKPKCRDNDKYRKIDGSCNNKQNPLFGMSTTPLQRIAPAEYGDLRTTPRRARSGAELPSARLVSTSVLRTDNTRLDSNGVSTFFVQMGQFIDHDISLSPDQGQQCCDKDNRDRPWLYPANYDPLRCAPIRVPDNDPVWGRRGRTCFDFSRSCVGIAIPDCQITSVMEQVNVLTHWLDASHVYGSTQQELDALRVSSSSPYLKVDVRRGRGGQSRGLLPLCSGLRSSGGVTSCEEVCHSDQGRQCVAAGDGRANEQPGLATLHTLWVREHNRLATELINLNPTVRVDGGVIFEEARRILIAEWQHIIYQEWLPILLGPSYMKSFDLVPTTDSYNNNYDARMDPRINNEFSTAAFRFGHSMMPRHIASRDRNSRDKQRFTLDETFFNSSVFQDKDFVENLLRGQISEPAAAWDSGFNEDLRNHLFEEELDLTSLNIQRGREHGLPGYNTYRDICSSTRSQFRRVRSWEELARGDIFSEDDISRLRAVYDDVDDVDLFTAGVMEKSHDDAIIGPTFKCIIGDQFTRLKRGDRFWYENGVDQDTRLSLDQLRSVKRVSMARIVCDNSDVEEIQPLVFRTETNINKKQSCSDILSIPRLDLTPWR